MAAVYHDSPPRKQCTSPSCCSPLRVWRTLQTIIQNDAKDEFARLCESTPSHVLTRVLLTSRLSNDPALYTPSQKSRVIHFPIHVRQEAVRKFGKAVTDLNALQLALVQKSLSLVMPMLTYLSRHESDLAPFVNHIWGHRNTTLHLACFWNMPRLVRLLVDLGADCTIRNARLVAPKDCATPDCLALLATATTPSKPIHTRPSMLLKKAAERSTMAPKVLQHHDDLIAPEYFDKKTEDHHRIMRMSPMSFSSSSSSSSFSSLSSTEESTIKSDDLWTPPPSPMTIAEKHTFSASPPPWSPTDHDGTVVVGFPPSPPSPVPTRPACFPAIRKIAHDDAEDDEEEDQPPQRRQVRFDPQVVLVDVCTRGDLSELSSALESVRTDMMDASNRSLLHIALMNGHEKVAKCLIDSDKIDVNHADNNGWTAVHYASRIGLWRSLEHLASLDQTDLHAKTHEGYLVHDCPVTEVDKRRCRLVIERAQRRAIKTRGRASSC
ncbi:ankyrin repeat-containing domain protein [Fennellomyces sp. T-0311]|nr:ankyrin repeat-containing domain protein [Fennellomyces sp. T-0311]